MSVLLFDSITPVARWVGFLSLPLLPIGLWMGALVAKHARVRVVLAVTTALLLVVVFFSLYSFYAEFEDEAMAGCEFIPAADDGVVRRDAELCEYLDNGSLERDRNLVFLVAGVTWVAPLVVLYAFRRRFRPNDQQGSEWELEATRPDSD